MMDFSGPSDTSLTSFTSRVIKSVRSGAITPSEGADLLAFRDQLKWDRRPWWSKARFLSRMAWS